MNVLKIIVMVIGALVLLSIALHLLGIVTGVVFGLLPLMLMLAGGYFIFMLVFKALAGKKEAKYQTDFKLSGSSPRVFLFREEPTIQDLVKLHDELHMTQLELSGSVFLADKDSHVIVLEDKGGESVKIKLKKADNKADAIGWVDRGSLVTEKKLITG